MNTLVLDALAAEIERGRKDKELTGRLRALLLPEASLSLRR